MTTKELPESTQIAQDLESAPVKRDFEEYTQLAEAGPGRGWWGPPKGTHGSGSQGGKPVSGKVNTAKRSRLTGHLFDKLHSAGGYGGGGPAPAVDKREGWIQLESNGKFSPNKHVPSLLGKWGYQQVSSMPKGSTSSPWAGTKGSKWFQSKDGNTVLEFIDERRSFPAVVQVNVYD